MKIIKNLFKKIPRVHIEPEKKQKYIDFLNKYSLIFHALLSMTICFLIEVISRHSFIDALGFITGHTLAFTYNSFIIFTFFALVYLFRRRMFFRIIISGLWLFLGTVNGCILSNRVTPFGYTDLKCVSDLLTMQNTNYFSATEAFIVVSIVLTFIVFCIYIFIKGAKYKGKSRKLVNFILVCLCFVMLPVTTKAARECNIVASYFSNIAQGYKDYGFVYGFSTSVVDRGMRKPKKYNQKTVKLAQDNSKKEPSSTTNNPNIIVVLLESFIDPTDVNFLEFSKDPVPNFRKLYNNYSSGYLTVPVVGAGTANSEFEVLTGMSMRYFGTGEYPYKTILKETDCESIASDLSNIGYGTHAVHNNGGNFYSRANAFSMMGFDSFTSKELMDIYEYTPLKSWPTDNILVNETIKALDSTENQPDFVYTITVQGHGYYPTEKVLENPEIIVSGAEDEETNYQWEYYVNMIHEVDKFINNLTKALEQRDEDTIVVFFGDHLPTLNLEDGDMASGSIFKTKYVTWNNFGLEKKDADVTAFELLANTTNNIGIHEGTIFTYEQNALDNGITHTEEYYNGLNYLQYDLLYGKRFAYEGTNPYPASNLVMGVEEPSIIKIWPTSNSEYVVIDGRHFTNWSKVYVNGSSVDTTYSSGSRLLISSDDIEDGDVVVVNQVGSSSTIFRSSRDYLYNDPNVIRDETDANATGDGNVVTDDTGDGNANTDADDTGDDNANTDADDTETDNTVANEADTTNDTIIN